MKKRRITEFKRGEKLFHSNGISKVKVTRGEEVECLEIPIQSTGISELIDAFQEKAPVPPLVNELVEPDSEIGKQLGLTKKDWIKMPNLADPSYIKEKADFDSDLGIAIVMKGLDVEIKDEDGSIVEKKEDKIKILKEMGLSGDQFSQLVNDITSLTRWSEKELTNFLG